MAYYLPLLKRFRKCKTIEEDIISTRSMEKLNLSMGSATADGENLEAAAMPSSSAWEVEETLVTTPAKKAKKTTAKKVL